MVYGAIHSLVLSGNIVQQTGSNDHISVTALLPVDLQCVEEHSIYVLLIMHRLTAICQHILFYFIKIRFFHLLSPSARRIYSSALCSGQPGAVRP